jgi:hypothetical protein
VLLPLPPPASSGAALQTIVEPIAKPATMNGAQSGVAVSVHSVDDLQSWKAPNTVEGHCPAGSQTVTMSPEVALKPGAMQQIPGPPSTSPQSEALAQATAASRLRFGNPPSAKGLVVPLLALPVLALPLLALPLLALPLLAPLLAPPELLDPQAAAKAAQLVTAKRIDAFFIMRRAS